MSSQKQGTLIRNMTSGPLARQILLFSLPLAGANLLQALYTMVDLWVVGQFASSAAISAVSISGQIVFLLHAAGMGLGNGGSVLIAQQVGAKDYQQLNRTIGTMLSTCTLASVVIALVGALGSSLWLDLLNTPADALGQASQYLFICCLGVPFVYVGGTLCAILRGIGDSRAPMYTLGLSAVVNMVLDYLFVAVFHWGAAGAAWATVIAQVVSAIYALVFIYRRREQLGFDFKPSSFKIDRETNTLLWKLGTPLIITQAAITISMLVVVSFINVYGIPASSATGIGSKLCSLSGVVTMSIQTAISSIAAQNFAADELGRVRRSVHIGLTVCLIFFVFLGTAVLLFPTQIFRVFTSDPEVLALAVPYLRTFFVLASAFALMAPYLGLVTAVGNNRLNLIIALLDGVVARIGLAWLLGDVLGYGLEGYWWGYAASSYVSVFMGAAYFYFGGWPKRQKLV